MNEYMFRIKATAVLKTANERNNGRLSELDIAVAVTEAIRIAEGRIDDCPGPLGGFWDAVGYMGDILFGCGEQNPTFGAHHVIEAMWGMPNWTCVTENHCWDCMYEKMPGRIGELGNRSTMYLAKEDRETITIRIDGLWAVQYKRNGATGWSDRSEQRAKMNALGDLMKKAGTGK